MEAIGREAGERGYFTKGELIVVCRWKTPRSQSRVASNEAAEIEELTRFALSTSSERARIGIMPLLHGVAWPTASVLLHFAHREPYPILDYRALWSLDTDKPPYDYTFPFWIEYVTFCRAVAKQAGRSMRTLDRALWQYSKENQ